MGYVIIGDKKYRITEIEGDEVYYRDEYGIERAISTHLSIDKFTNCPIILNYLIFLVSSKKRRD